MRAVYGAIRRALGLFGPSTSGYEDRRLVDLIARKTAAYNSQSTIPEVAGMDTVLDFGGGAGIHFKASGASCRRWAVVETPTMVERAQEFETDRLRFFSSISEAAAWLGTIDMVHSNGALQYTPDPLVTARNLVALNAKRMLYARLFLTSSDVTKSEDHVSLLADNGPGRAFVSGTAHYTRRSIPEAKFIAIHGGYRFDRREDNGFFFERI